MTAFQIIAIYLFLEIVVVENENETCLLTTYSGFNHSCMKPSSLKSKVLMISVLTWSISLKCLFFDCNIL